jgi:predicted dehydrogenase
MNQPMRLGMLGMWHSHADGLVRQVAEHPDEFQIVACWDPEPEVVLRRTKEWEPRVPGLKVVDGPERVLAETLDGVVVESRVHNNLRLARMALEHGRSVMLEKPAGDRLDDHRALIELAQRNHLHVQMIYLFRYMSAVQEMLRCTRAGELGRVYEFRARLPKALSDYDRFVEELRPYRGGMYFEMAGHVIDMMVAVLGKPKEVNGFLGHHHTAPPNSYIDNALAVFEFDHAWGIVEVPAIEVAPHSRRIEVYGTEGACVIPHLGSGHLPNKNIQPIEIYRTGAADWRSLELPAATLHISDLREFAAVVGGRKTPDFTMEHDLIVQESLLRACRMA